MCATSLGWRHLVNAYRVRAGWLIPFMDKHVGGRLNYVIFREHVPFRSALEAFA